jgi:5-methylcytosine-specific restriction endonuclease McrA
MGDMMSVYGLSPAEFHFEARFRNKTKVSKVLRRKVLDRDRHLCLKCGSTALLTMDHINPTSQGGLTRYNNLQTLCRTCNSQKGAARKDYRK